VLPQGALHPDLVARLSAECVRIGQSVLTMCIRAFDYLPPADVTFGAFLRALVTADWELNPLDELGVRAALIEACRRRGIFAAEAGSLAVNALLLDVASDSEWSKHKDAFSQWVDLGIQLDIEEQRSATPEDIVEDQFIETSVANAGLKQAPPVRSDLEEWEACHTAGMEQGRPARLHHWPGWLSVFQSQLWPIGSPKRCIGHWYCNSRQPPRWTVEQNRSQPGKSAASGQELCVYRFGQRLRDCRWS
jgi:hypothetical protein